MTRTKAYQKLISWANGTVWLGSEATIFASLFADAWRSVERMKFPDQHTFAAAWRKAVVAWLRRQALISVTDQQQTHTNKQFLLPHFSEKWPH